MAMRKYSRWRHKLYPNSLDIVVLAITKFDIVEGARGRDRYLEGPFADVQFSNGRSSIIRVSDIEKHYEEVTA